MQENKGLSSARNAGVQESRARYVMLLDSDDLLEPTALEKLAWFLESRPGLAFAKGFNCGFGAQQYLWRDGFHSGDRFLQSNCATATAMVRRNVYQDVGGMSVAFRTGMEDWEFWIKCAANGYWGDTIPEFLEWYRRRPTHTDRWEALDDEEALRLHLKESYPAVFEKGITRPKHESRPAKTELSFANRLAKPPGVRRLLLILPHLELGGADKFNLDLIKCLQNDHGWEVTVVTTLDGPHPWRARFLRLTPEVFTLNTFLPVHEYPAFLEYLTASRDYDTILISNSQMGYQLLPFLRTSGAVARFGDYVHMEQEDWKNGGYPRYSLNYSPFLDFTAASSEHLRSWMVQRGGEPDKISVCTCNIDTEVWDRRKYKQETLRAKYDVPADTPVIAYAARFTDQKQPELMADVVRLLREKGRRFICLAAGDGPDFPAVEQFVARHGIKELRLLGARSNAEIGEILAISDLYFMPSRMEGIALAIYEAMAMEVVPVAADVGGQRELITPDCGVLLRHDAPAADWAEALDRLLVNTAERIRMARACRERTQRYFDLQTMGDRMSEILGNDSQKEFDLRVAFRQWRHGVASEAVEYRRLEMVAEELWRSRGQTAARSEVANTERQRMLAETIAPPEPEYVGLLEMGGRILRGNLFLLPRLIQASGLTIGGLARSAILVCSPRQLPSKMRNLRLLSRVLLNPAARARMLTRFDARFYREEYEDVRNAGVIPLLHYCLIGHAEGRTSSPSFNLGWAGESPHLATKGINPLLWSVLNCEVEFQPIAPGAAPTVSTKA
jgi:glycosyltransferase involved in cell wall biosynthesis